jgi:hypothetical protein
VGVPEPVPDLVRVCVPDPVLAGVPVPDTEGVCVLVDVWKPEGVTEEVCVFV